MAATPFPPPFHASFSPFDIFHDGGAPRNTPPPPPSPSLPGGPCNFVELSHGPNGPKCGCRRFWSSQATGQGNRTTDQTGWCMCSHHACFHDDAQNTQNTQAVPAPMPEDVPGQENEKPRSNRAPLSPVQDFTSFHMPSGLGGAAMDFAALNFNSFQSNLGLGANTPQYHSAEYHPPQSIPPGPAPDTDSLPDTLSWRNFNSSQGGQTPLPPIPSPCLMPHSQSASTTASSQMRYLRPFGGKGMNTLSRVPRAQDPNKDDLQNTNTGVDTVLGIMKECHTRNDTIAVPSGAATPTPGSARGLGTPRPASVLSAGQSNADLQGLADTVQDHEQRLESLENGSIYNTALEEFSEKHDMADLRVTELEHRMDDVERRLTDDNTSVASSHPVTQRDNDATASEVSASSNVTARAADSVALARLLEPLEARVTQLESSSLPSYTSPWELEVVFLPFPLKGIWIGAQDFKARSPFGGQDELPNTNSRATPMPQALAAYDEWVSHDSGWLLPKACVPGKTIDQRLRSRGFSKTVQVRGGGYRSVQLAIGNAFESILSMMPHPDSPRSPYATDSRVDKYLGLQQSWVPLRKVHKDPRLRFLSPPELLTPAIWNATFLMDSVVMKATGMHRLYITQPEAYLQDNHVIRSHGLNSGWAWQKLRELDRVYSDSQASNDSTPEADALEEYWAFDARLDDPPSSRQSSVGLRHSHDRDLSISRMTDRSSEQYWTAPSIPNASMASPSLVRGQSPFTHSERRGSRPPFVQTGSVPRINSPDITSPAHSGRHVSSSSPLLFLAGPSYQRHPSPLATGRPSPRVSTIANNPAISMITKSRRRSTRSPSFRLNTPRYSNRSYSRSPSVTVQALYNFTYNTPHSNAPPLHSPRQISNSHNVHFDEEDEDMDFDDDRGSLTDHLSEESDDDAAEDDDADMSEYEDKADVLDNLPQGPEDIPRQGIEDNILDHHGDMGSQEFDSDSDDEDADDNSDAASTPSEYPSKLEEHKQLKGQWSGVGDLREGTSALEDDYGPALNDFLIHEDSDGEEEQEPEAQTLY
ncbi:hypothetical protein VMCG_08162 [Cytospora schulzeri]|uniref:Uncharacterized protein n=1 Tax=Cytospora schulzeri TaxID=448051 RepID=A0A423VU72_9PEZI|nr:hypothetical protein VMCG_08162 [Valsa malicola]